MTAIVQSSNKSLVRDFIARERRVAYDVNSLVDMSPNDIKLASDNALLDD